jgi:hypothetical protein
MPNVYVQAQPNGGPEGSALEDHVQTTCLPPSNTAGDNRLVQKERHVPLVAHVRLLIDKKKRDDCRAA